MKVARVGLGDGQVVSEQILLDGPRALEQPGAVIAGPGRGRLGAVIDEFNFEPGQSDPGR